MNRFEMYLYSRKNIVGTVCGITGLGLGLAGLAPIGIATAGIAAALYAAGALATPSGNDNQQLTVNHNADAGTIKKQLAKLVAQIDNDKRLPDTLVRRVRSIQDSINTILDRTRTGVAGDPLIYDVRKTALEYLPEALNIYLSLPPTYVKTHPNITKDLDTQLCVMDDKMKQVVEDVLAGDSQKLRVHGRFLQERFGVADSSLRIHDGDS